MYPTALEDMPGRANARAKGLAASAVQRRSRRDAGVSNPYENPKKHYFVDNDQNSRYHLLYIYIYIYFINTQPVFCCLTFQENDGYISMEGFV